MPKVPVTSKHPFHLSVPSTLNTPSTLVTPNFKYLNTSSSPLSYPMPINTVI